MNAAMLAAPTPFFKLRDGLRFVPQRGGKRWYCIIEDALTKRYYRVGRREYLVLSLLDGTRSPDMILQILSSTHSEFHVDKQTIEQTLRWLASVGLLLHESLPNPPSKKASTPQRLTGDPFSFRLTLFRGDQLHRWLDRWQFLGSRTAMFLGCLLIGLGVLVYARDMQGFQRLTSQLFVPSHVACWFVAWMIMKIVHETGHAVACIAHGGELRGAGIGFFYFAPVPFVDATDMWRLPDRRARAACAASGMWFEMCVSAVAILLCSVSTIPSFQYFAMTMATLGSVTTLLFNANPLMRFDGYYLLSDLLDRPNLWQEGQNAWQGVTSGFFRGDMRRVRSVVSQHGLAMVGYGAACTIHRVVIMIALAWGAWATYGGIGLGLIALAAYLWFVRPWSMRSRLQKKNSSDATALPNGWMRLYAPAILVGIGLASFALPSPWQPRSPGYVSHGDPWQIRAESKGIIDEIYGADGEVVEAGSPILVLANPALKWEADDLRVRYEIASERCRVLRAQGRFAELQSEEGQVEATRKQLEHVEQQLEKLVVRAPRRGTIVARQLEQSRGKFVEVGQALATVIDPQALEIRCSVSQQDVAAFRSREGMTVSIELADRPPFQATIDEVLPRGKEELDNPILAARYGGPLAVEIGDADDVQPVTLQTLQPRFDARLSMTIDQAKELRSGELCMVRLEQRPFTLADAFQRWTSAFLDWLRPDETATS